MTYRDMPTRSRRGPIAQRLGMVAIVVVVAVVFLSSGVLAAIVSAVTTAALLLDLFAFGRLQATEGTDRSGPDATPRSLTVDLSRRS
jgi:hypothetical protein